MKKLPVVRIATKPCGPWMTIFAPPLEPAPLQPLVEESSDNGSQREIVWNLKAAHRLVSSLFRTMHRMILKHTLAQSHGHIFNSRDICAYKPITGLDLESPEQPCYRRNYLDRITSYCMKTGFKA